MESKDCTMNRDVALAGGKVPLRRGTIVGPVSSHAQLGEVVVVEWKDSGQLQKVTPRSLLTESEAMAKEEEWQVAAIQLEKDFDKVTKKVKAKMEEVASLVDEAAKLAKAGGHDLYDMYEAVRPLLRAMDRAGWSTSSLSC